MSSGAASGRFKAKGAAKKYQTQDEADVGAIADKLDAKRQELEKKLDDGEQFDWDDAMQDYAREEILASKDCDELIMKTELLVDDEWIQNIDALPGNVYTIMAFENLIDPKVSLRSLANLKALAKYFGCALVCMIQIIGPPLVFISKTTPYGIISEEKLYMWRYWRFSTTYDPEVAVPIYFDWIHFAPTKVLAIAFLVLFILNAYFFLSDFSKSWVVIYNINRWLDMSTPEFVLTGQKWLWLGGLVNCWVVVWCALSMYLVTGGSRCPQDVILDSLGLVFLFNLDDISGALGFVDEDDWPGKRLGWIHKKFVATMHPDDFNPDDYTGDPMGKLVTILFRVCLKLTAFCGFALPCLAAVTPFLMIAPSD
jgi:hypothetical protein